MSDESDGWSVKEVLSKLDGKLDGLSAQVSALGQSTAVTIAELSVRVLTLEKSADRKWSLIGTWIGCAVSVGIGLAGIFMR
jgi:hypothetical protein